MGQVGFGDPRREIVPSLDGIPEAGWVLASWAHGNGYATEAVNAALAWADHNLPHSGSVCLIRPGNVASFRVAEKAGYSFEELGLLDDRETTILRRPRSLP